MDLKLYAATHQAVRVTESEDWAKVLRVETAYDIHEDIPYMSWGYLFTIRRNTGEIRYTVTDDRSIAPVGSLVYYMDDQGRACLRVEGRRGDVVRLDVANARVALDYLGEYVFNADREAC